MTADSPSHYIIRGGEAGRERLRVLSRAVAPATLAFLQRLGISEGARWLDAGCGGGDVTLELARLTGPGGLVTGIDIDEIKLTIARQEARQAGASNVHYLRAGIDQLDTHSAFDVAYARFLLSHLPDPAQAVRRLVRATRPGGVVAVEDVDFAGCFSHPANDAYTTFCDLFTRAGHARGVDPEVGPRLPGMFLAAGLTDVGVHLAQPAGYDRDIKALMPLTLENIADSVIALEFMSRQQIDALVNELYAFAAQPATILSLPRIFQVWGTVPVPGRAVASAARSDRARARPLAAPSSVRGASHDLVTRGGRVADGTGAPLRSADVAVSGGRVVAVGLVIDLEHLQLRPPTVHYDLPATGRRLLQRAQGYRHTFVAGVETFADGEATGALPGRLVRGPQPPPA